MQEQDNMETPTEQVHPQWRTHQRLTVSKRNRCPRPHMLLQQKLTPTTFNLYWITAVWRVFDACWEAQGRETEQEKKKWNKSAFIGNIYSFLESIGHSIFPTAVLPWILQHNDSKVNNEEAICACSLAHLLKNKKASMKLTESSDFL